MLSKTERQSRSWLRQHNICTNNDELFEHHIKAEQAGLVPTNAFRKCMSHVLKPEIDSSSIRGDKAEPRQLSKSSSNSEDLHTEWEAFKNGKAI